MLRSRISGQLLRRLGDSHPYVQNVKDTSDSEVAVFVLRPGGSQRLKYILTFVRLEELLCGAAQAERIQLTVLMRKFNALFRRSGSVDFSMASYTM